MRSIIFALGLSLSSTALAQDAPGSRVATAGDVIWTNAPPPTWGEEIVLLQPAKGGGLLSTSGSVDVPEGTVLTYIDTKRGKKACVLAPTYVIIGHVRACLVDDDGDGSFDHYSYNENGKLAALKAPAKYSVKPVAHSERPSFERRVIYLGATPTTLSLSYREFRDDLARSAFTEELSVPLSSAFPQTVRFKGLEMEISSISGMGMRYSIKPIVQE